jgi:hypothetical protein
MHQPMPCPADLFCVYVCDARASRPRWQSGVIVAVLVQRVIGAAASDTRVDARGWGGLPVTRPANERRHD